MPLVMTLEGPRIATVPKIGQRFQHAPRFVPGRPMQGLAGIFDAFLTINPAAPTIPMLSTLGIIASLAIGVFAGVRFAGRR